FEITPTDELRDLHGEMTVRRSLFVLGRNAGVRSTPGDSISSAHCPNCGGAVMTDTSNACEFCHTVLNDGARRWVLRDIFTSGTKEDRALRAEAVVDSNREMAEFRTVGSPAASGGTGALVWMISSVVSEGCLSDDSIREMLRAAGKRKGLGAEKVDALIRSAAAGQMETPHPANTTLARAWLLEIAVAAHLTGGLSKQEAKLIEAVGKRHSLTAADVACVLKCARRDAFQQATAQLKTAEQQPAQGRSAR
ncbi:MAG: hypothetical protein ABIP20_12375, partial [Chthoniobacteraceae bacterium]